MSVAGGGEGWLHELLTLEHGTGAVPPRLLGAAQLEIELPMLGSIELVHVDAKLALLRPT